jgi:hypothetical protein
VSTEDSAKRSTDSAQEQRHQTKPAICSDFPFFAIFKCTVNIMFLCKFLLQAVIEGYVQISSKNSSNTQSLDYGQFCFVPGPLKLNFGCFDKMWECK